MTATPTHAQSTKADSTQVESPESALPSGVLQLTPALRRVLPAQRGRSAGARLPALPKVLEQLALIPRQNSSRSSRVTHNPPIRELFERHPLPELLSVEGLQQDDRERWRTALLMTQFLSRQRNQPHPAATVMQACLHWHGPLFASSCYFAALRQHKDLEVVWFLADDAPGCEELAAALASASEADYLAARADALAAAPAHDAERFARGAVFNTEAPLIEDALRVVELGDHADHVTASGVIGARLSLAQATRIIDGPSRRSFDDAAPPLALNLLDLHGEAAIPLLARLLARPLLSAAARGRVAAILRAADSPTAFAVLLQHIAQKEVRPAIDGFAKDYPRVAMQVADARTPEHAAAIKPWLTQLRTAFPDLIERPQAPSATKRPDTDSGPTQAGEAPLDALPPVLRDPPWLKPTKAPKLVDLPAVELPAARMCWPEGLREQWQASMPAGGDENQLPMRGDRRTRTELALCRLGIPTTLIPPLLAGTLVDLAPHRAELESTARRGRKRAVGELGHLRPALRLLLWNSLPGFAQPAWDRGPASAAALIAHYELAALPGLLAFIRNDPEPALAAALPVAAAAIAGHAARAMGSKRARPAAMAWLRHHAELAVAELLRQSANSGKADADGADAALRWLSSQVDATRLAAGASHFAAAGALRLQAILAVDPLAQLPQKPRPLPAFFLPTGFRRPCLHDGRVLTAGALNALGTMLQVSRLDEPFVGIAQVKTACTSESLDAFAWDLYQAWERSDGPNKEAWAYQAIGLIGGDECVRALAPLIRRWPSEGLSARAVTALDILCAIGSDLALMHLHDISQTAKSASLRDHAHSRIEAIAEARDLSAEELADRLVPDLGLDADGTLSLDFGGRHFTVGFDEHLLPFVRDPSGTRLKDLPKPVAGDVAGMVQAAVERWKRLKKDAKAIAAQQIQRLEALMCSDRRLEMEVFERYYLRHPLMSHLARRLLWGAYDTTGRGHAFRIAEDRSFADRQDQTWHLPANSRVRPLHPLELDAGQLAAFVQIFADYEILQPFEQLARETQSMSAEELALTESNRFRGRSIASGSLHGLQRFGWRSPAHKESGYFDWFEKPLSGGVVGQIRFDPGISVVNSHTHQVHILDVLSLHCAGTDVPRTFAQLDPISRSELLRDLDRLPLVKR